jgi:hypothetical protein
MQLLIYSKSDWSKGKEIKWTKSCISGRCHSLTLFKGTEYINTHYLPLGKAFQDVLVRKGILKENKLKLISYLKHTNYTQFKWTFSSLEKRYLACQYCLKDPFTKLCKQRFYENKHVYNNALEAQITNSRPLLLITIFCVLKEMINYFLKSLL